MHRRGTLRMALAGRTASYPRFALRPLALVAAACLAAYLLPLAPLMPAAEAQPVRLTPTKPAGEEEKPQANTPPDTAKPAEEAQAAKPPRKATGVVAVQDLKAPDPSSRGLIDESNGGLGIQMWKGSTRLAADKAIAALPDTYPAPAERNLALRLLTSVAEVPDGPATDTPLLARRVERLYAMGALNEAAALAEMRPSTMHDAIFAQVAIDKALLRLDMDAACGMAAEAMKEAATPFLQRVTAICRYNAKDIAGGDLAVSLWRDQGGEDPGFQSAAAALRGDANVRPTSIGPSIVNLTAWRLSKRPLPPDTVLVASPAMLVALSGMKELDPLVRLAAAERAAMFGAIPPAKLGEAYAMLELSEADRTTLSAGREKNARYAAYLYQQARLLPPGPARIEMLRRYGDLADARNQNFAAALAVKDLLGNLVPTDESVAATPTIVRLALSAGETGTARLWYNFVRGQNPESPAGQAAANLWALMLVAEGSAWSDVSYQAWVDMMNDSSTERRTARQAMLLVMAEAADVKVPKERWDDLVVPGLTNDRAASALAYWRNMTEAANIKARAETVALMLAIFGPKGAASTNSITLSSTIRFLRSIGLEKDAQALLIQTAIARDL